MPSGGNVSYLWRRGSPPQLCRLHSQSATGNAAATSTGSPRLGNGAGRHQNRRLLRSLFFCLQDGRCWFDNYRRTRRSAGQFWMRVLPVYPVSPGCARLLAG